MGDKIVNTILVKQGNFGEQNNPHPSPPFKVGVIFVFYTSSWNSGTSKEWGRESSIVAFEVGKMSEKPFRAKFFN